MTILFDATRLVKSGRRGFALGLSAGRSDRPMPYTAADLQWWAENSPNNRDGYEVVEPAPSDAELEQAAGCALAQARMDAGYSLF